MTLGQSQREFTHMVARLVMWAYENGYELTYGDAFRSPEQAAANAAKGIGISNSLHGKRLAVDFNLFIDGVYQKNSKAYEPLGVFWESIGGSWGGRFKDAKGKPKPDGNHFSLAWRGVR